MITCMPKAYMYSSQSFCVYSCGLFSTYLCKYKNSWFSLSSLPHPC